jgi:flagellum-specific ATP synthase
MLSEARVRDVTSAVRRLSAPLTLGRVVRVAGLLVEATVPGVAIGDLVEIERSGKSVIGEVVGFREELALIIPISEIQGLGPGARVRVGHTAGIPVGDALLGRVVDAFGRPLDGHGPLLYSDTVRIDAPALPIERRAQVRERFETGIRVIDGLLTAGRGQRLGVFAGAGVGKSMLVEQIATQSFADVTVIGLIGERGREVRELLGAAGRSKITAVAATSDRSPMERVRGALAATAIAEHFRDRGANVLLVIDSLTRYAMALREIGLAAGEPPATKGYPPSVFAAMPRLLERVAPAAGGGSITGFYAVLVEGDDLADPVADSARSLLDAHIVLSRDLAARGQFPAVDVLASASRVALQVTERSTQELAQRVREILAIRREAHELRSLGAYSPGNNPTFDEALALGDAIDKWIRQRPGERSDFVSTINGLATAVKRTGGPS